MTCRKAYDDVEIGEDWLLQNKRSENPMSWLRGIRHGGGVNRNQAFVWNVRTCRRDVKGRPQVSGPFKGLCTDARHRDGAVCSSGDGS
jgi:hypothetical protein